MHWTLCKRADATARRFADRHYNRQSIGAANFAPPGRALVLREPRGFWITSWPFAEYVGHAWAGAWVCSAFRLEGGASGDASGLIREALAVTRWKWPTPPTIDAWQICRGPHSSSIARIRVAMVTMVDPEKTTAKRDPGRCFRRAGFVEIGRTKERGLVVLGLPVDALPLPAAPLGSQSGFDFASTPQHAPHAAR